MSLLLLLPEPQHPEIPLDAMLCSGYLTTKGLRHLTFRPEPGKEKEFQDYLTLYGFKRIALFGDGIPEKSLIHWIAEAQKQVPEIILLKSCGKKEAEYWLKNNVNYLLYSGFPKALNDLIKTLETPFNPFLDQVSGLMFRNYFAQLVQNPEPVFLPKSTHLATDTIDWSHHTKRIRELHGEFILQARNTVCGCKLHAQDQSILFAELASALKADSIGWPGKYYPVANPPCMIHVWEEKTLRNHDQYRLSRWINLEESIPPDDSRLCFYFHDTGKRTRAELKEMARLTPPRYQISFSSQGKCQVLKRGPWPQPAVDRTDSGSAARVKYLLIAWRIAKKSEWRPGIWFPLLKKAYYSLFI